MITKWIKSVITSVFTKFLLLTCATVFLINVSIIGMLWVYKMTGEQHFKRNMTQYLNYIIEDIGTPPTLENALKISRETAVQIHHNGQGQDWSTSKSTFLEEVDFEEIDFHGSKKHPNLSFGGYDHGFLVKYSVPSGIFYFEFVDENEDTIRETIAHILFFLIPTLILTATYFLTKKILRPLRNLTEGVEQVGSGNLSHTIPVSCCDELGNLAGSFNDMTSKLKDILHTKERLLLDVSHELRTPLTRMKLALEFLPEEDRKSLSEDIIEMETMITSILETAKMHHSHTKLQIQETECVALLQKIGAQYEGVLPQISLYTPTPPIICHLDKEQIRSVVQNIIENAIKYSKKDSQPIKVKLSISSGEITIKVVDNGIGIQKEDLPFIMEPFYRADKSRSKETGGYGLGLSLCKTIMEAHNGRIEITSTYGEGTSVRLTLPQHNDGTITNEA